MNVNFVIQSTFMKNKKVDKIRAWLLTSAVEGIKPIYALLFQRDKTPWEQSIQSLKAHPQKSLGWELGHFLDGNGFDLIPLYENHDVYHVLLNYEAEVVDEAAMQFFLLGNQKITPSVVITVLFSCLILPEYIGYFIKEFKKGRNATRIGKWDFQFLLKEPLKALQNQVFRKNEIPCLPIF